MTQIDCSDCWFSLEIGDGVRRSLINHFRAWIVDQLGKQGWYRVGVNKPDVIEAFAWRLSSELLSKAKDELAEMDTTDAYSGAPEALEIFISDEMEAFLAGVAKADWAAFLEEIANAPPVALGGGPDDRQ
jgi:hypothetical protein